MPTKEYAHGASWGVVTIGSLVAASAVGVFVCPLVAMEERVMRNSILLFAVVVLAVVVDTAHARIPAPILRFGNHGSFKIVQVEREPATESDSAFTSIAEVAQ